MSLEKIEHRVRDFGTGVRPPAQWFQNVAFVLQQDPLTEDYSVPTELLVSFLNRFDHWYKDTLGIGENERLHLLYRRSLSLLGEHTLSYPEHVRTLSEAGMNCGFGVVLGVSFDQATEYFETLKGLIEDRVIHRLDLSFEASGEQNLDAQANMIEWLFNQGCAATLIGPMSLFRATKCLSSDAVCSGNVTLCATATTEDGARHRKAMEVANCHNRFSVYVNQDGAIYPCMGLLGLPAAHMGFVHEPLEDTVFGYRATVLDFDELAHTGPRLPILGDDEGGETESYCQRHRRALAGVNPAPVPVVAHDQGEMAC